MSFILTRLSSCARLRQASYVSVSIGFKCNGIEFVRLCSYILQLPFSAYASKGMHFKKVYRLSSESSLYKFIYLSACIFAV